MLKTSRSKKDAARWGLVAVCASLLTGAATADVNPTGNAYCTNSGDHESCGIGPGAASVTGDASCTSNGDYGDCGGPYIGPGTASVTGDASCTNSGSYNSCGDGFIALGAVSVTGDASCTNSGSYDGCGDGYVGLGAVSVTGDASCTNSGRYSGCGDGYVGLGAVSVTGDASCTNGWDHNDCGGDVGLDAVSVAGHASCDRPFEASNPGSATSAQCIGGRDVVDQLIVCPLPSVGIEPVCHAVAPCQGGQVGVQVDSTPVCTPMPVVCPSPSVGVQNYGGCSTIETCNPPATVGATVNGVGQCLLVPVPCAAPSIGVQPDCHTVAPCPSGLGVQVDGSGSCEPQPCPEGVNSTTVAVCGQDAICPMGLTDSPGEGQVAVLCGQPVTDPRPDVLPRCLDGLDNDGDGKADYAPLLLGGGDPQCTNPLDNDEGS